MAEDSERDPGAVSQTAARLGAVGAGIVSVWHRVLSSIVTLVVRSGRALAGAARRWAAQWPRVIRYHLRSAAPWTTDDARGRETAAAAGLRAFVFGIVAAAILESTTRNAALAGLGLAVVEVVWAAARFIIIALLMPRDAIDRPRLSVAYLAGLLPFVFGLTLPLRIVALLASAFLTRQGLLGAGVGRADATRAVGWAFGGQAAVVALGWIVRGLFALAVL